MVVVGVELRAGEAFLEVLTCAPLADALSGNAAAADAASVADAPFPTTGVSGAAPGVPRALPVLTLAGSSAGERLVVLLLVSFAGACTGAGEAAVLEASGAGVCDWEGRRGTSSRACGGRYSFDDDGASVRRVPAAAAAAFVEGSPGDALTSAKRVGDRVRDVVTAALLDVPTTVAGGFACKRSSNDVPAASAGTAALEALLVLVLVPLDDVRGAGVLPTTAVPAFSRSPGVDGGDAAVVGDTAVDDAAALLLFGFTKALLRAAKRFIPARTASTFAGAGVEGEEEEEREGTEGAAGEPEAAAAAAGDEDDGLPPPSIVRLRVCEC